MPVKISNKPLVSLSPITREKLQNDELVRLSSGRLPYEYYVVVVNALDETTRWSCALEKDTSYFDLYKIVRVSMNLRASTSLRLILKADDEQCVLPCCRDGSCTKRLNRRTLLCVRTGG
jgi:hypothetical protein